MLTELVEFAFSLAPAVKGQEQFAGFPHLQAFRLFHATQLADAGHVSQAQKSAPPCPSLRASLTHDPAQVHRRHRQHAQARHQIDTVLQPRPRRASQSPFRPTYRRTRPRQGWLLARPQGPSADDRLALVDARRTFQQVCRRRRRASCVPGRESRRSRQARERRSHRPLLALQLHLPGKHLRHSLSASLPDRRLRSERLRRAPFSPNICRRATRRWTSARQARTIQDAPFEVLVPRLCRLQLRRRSSSALAVVPAARGRPRRGCHDAQGDVARVRRRPRVRLREHGVRRCGRCGGERERE